MTAGLEVLVQEVIAAIVTDPWPISAVAPLASHGLGRNARPVCG